MSTAKRPKDPPPARHFRTPGLAAVAEPLVTAGVLSEAHLQLVDIVAPRFGETRPEALLALALVLEAEGRGHTALDFTRLETLIPSRREPEGASTKAEDPPAPPAEDDARGGDDETVDDDGTAAPPEAPSESDDAPPPGPSMWSAVAAGAAMLANCPLVGGPDAAERPFAVLPPRPSDPATLYLTRRLVDEQRRVAKRLVGLATDRPEGFEVSAVELVERALRSGRKLEVQGARGTALCLDGHRLTVITGGPGTGKTFSVARTLAELMKAAEAKGLPHPRIALAAPTGKAAVRMIEAMAKAVKPDANKEEQPPFEPELAKALTALNASTLHKLLGVRPDTGVPRHGPENPLPYEVVVVDEASMLDVVLMRKLLEAIGERTRLILLGDRDQLASVDAGTVLADVVAGHFAAATDALSTRTVFYTESLRFGKESKIGKFAKKVQTPRGAESLPERTQRLLEAVSGIASGDTWQSLEDASRPVDAVIQKLAAPYLEGYVKLLVDRIEGKRDPQAAARPADPKAPQTSEEAKAKARAAQAKPFLEAFDAYRILCTHRRGARGVAGLNRTIGAAVQKKLSEAWSHHRKVRNPTRGEIFHGMPVLITENAYDLELRNGDIGLALQLHGDRLEVYFPNRAEALPISRLPPHMPAFALTIHKSQGSEYERVAVVLAGRPSPIETRELVYTGVTRAKKNVCVYGSNQALRAALGRPVGRVSALQRFIADALGVETYGNGPVETGCELAGVGVGTPLERARAAVFAASTALPRASIRDATHITEAEWNDIRHDLEAQRDVVRMGHKRGTKYASWSVFLELLVNAVRDADTGEGARREFVLEAFAKLYGEPEKSAWKRAINELVASKRVLHEGETKARRYWVSSQSPTE